MKKIYLISLVLTACVFTGQSQYREGYYDAMNGKKKEQLKAAVKTCVSGHTRLIYNDLPNNWRYTDTYPDLYDGCLRWWEMYSNNIFLIRNGQAATSSFSANRMQREHSVPKSWWKYNNDVEYTPAYTDLWNLYPSDGTCNQAKSNYPFGVVADGKATFDNGSAKVGTPASGYGGGAAMVFEPANEYKGDFARTIFYMACVYDEIQWSSSYSFNMFQKNTWPTLKPWAYETLLEWHRADPVSQKEIDRNNAVESQQGNRNPFIDFPDLAEYIWGTSTGQVFYLEDQGGNATPLPNEAYIERPVYGEALEFGQCATGGSMTRYLEIHGMIREPLSVSMSGADKEMFTLGATTVTPSQLNHTQTFLLPVSFSPTRLGEMKANLLLYGGGLATTGILVQLIGEGAAVPQLSRLTAYEATEISESGYTANWSVAPEVVDYYVVTRVINGSDGTETETLESNENSLRIMRVENVMESYSVQSSRLGYLSEASNSITVGRYNGIYNTDAEWPFDVQPEGDGFTLVGGIDSIDAVVYDIQGRVVYINPTLVPGEHVSLPSGLYLLNSRLLNRPLKILVP